MQRGYEVSGPAPRHPTGGHRPGRGSAPPVLDRRGRRRRCRDQGMANCRRPCHPCRYRHPPSGVGGARAGRRWRRHLARRRVVGVARTRRPGAVPGMGDGRRRAPTIGRGDARCSSRSRVSASRCGCVVGRVRDASPRGEAAIRSRSRASDERLRPDRVARVSWEHVVGELDPTWLGDARAGGRLASASNRVRVLIERGAAHLPDDQAALTRGLVIGDDRDQPPDDGPALPGQRALAPDRRLGAERVVRAGRGRAAARPRPPVAALDGDRRADRLVRRAHARRAEHPPGRSDGRAQRHRVSCSAASGSRRACWPWPSRACC